MESLVIASHNAGKVREFSALLAPLDINVIPAAALNLPEPEETGATFAENAALKAVAAAHASAEIALADDSGLVIPSLDGAPGIHSARWAGGDKNFPAAFARIEAALAEKQITRGQPVPAYFICVLCVSTPEGKVAYFEGRVDGKLTFPPRGKHGFGYDPIFTPDGHGQTFAEMDPATKQTISHRALASSKLLQWLRENMI